MPLAKRLSVLISWGSVFCARLRTKRVLPCKLAVLHVHTSHMWVGEILYENVHWQGGWVAYLCYSQWIPNIDSSLLSAARGVVTASHRKVSSSSPLSSSAAWTKVCLRHDFPTLVVPQMESVFTAHTTGYFYAPFFLMLIKLDESGVGISHETRF